MEIEYAKELDKILGTLQGLIPKKYQQGNEKFSGESISEIKKLQSKNGLNEHFVIIKDWDVDHLVEELQISRVNLCGYLEVLAEKGLVHLIKGGPSEIFAYASAKVAGIHFYRNGGFTKAVTNEITREQKEKEILEKQLEVAKTSADAAKSSSRFSKYLLWVTAINVFAVLVTTFFEFKTYLNNEDIILRETDPKIENPLILLPVDSSSANEEGVKKAPLNLKK